MGRVTLSKIDRNYADASDDDLTENCVTYDCCHHHIEMLEYFESENEFLTTQNAQLKKIIEELRIDIDLLETEARLLVNPPAKK